MIEVELSKLIIDEKRKEQIIVLKSKDGGRQLPIVIGFPEASSIKMRLSKVELPRPLTHDLICSVIKELDSQIDKIVIDKMVDSTFYAKLYIKNSQGEEMIVDARPSDSIAIAVRADVPIFVAEEVFDKASIFNVD